MSRSRAALAALCALLGLTAAMPAASAQAAAATLTWTAPQSVDPLRGGLASVTCVSASFCLAGSQNGSTATYNGTKWGEPVSVFADNSGMGSLSCLSATFCAGANVSREGSYRPMIFDGTTWTTGAYVEGIGAGGVSCVSTKFCLIVDNEGRFQRYNGTS